MRAFSIAACALLIGGLAAGAAAARTAARVTTATIVNSGSTNTAPFSVTVRSDGHVQTGRGPQASISKRLTAQFFGALRAAQRTAPAAGGCMKSASFGSVMSVRSAAWTSTDLNCPVSGANAALKTAAEAVLAAVKLDVPQRRTITLPANEPRRMPDAPVGSPAPSATPH